VPIIILNIFNVIPKEDTDIDPLYDALKLQHMATVLEARP
jgi:hypothetical protein